MDSLRLELPAAIAGRVGALDELKGVAILLVVLYHAGGVLGVSNTLHGEVGVDMFVILSGIGMALSSDTGTAGRFLLRRFWRIYPAYWIVLTAFLVGDALVLGRRFTAEDMLLHYLGLHAWFGDAYALSINDSFWFVTLIATLYLIYAPLRRLAEKPDRLLFAGALVSSAAAVYFFRARQYMAFDHLSLRIPGFFLGLLFGRLLKTGRLDLSASTALGAAFLLLFYVPFTHDFVYATSWVGAALMIGYTCLIRPFFSTGTRGALKFLGDRSLEIFLIHQPLMREYNILAQHELFPTAAVTAASMAAGIVIAVGVSVVIGAALHSLLGALPVPWRLSGQPTHHDNISPR